MKWAAPSCGCAADARVDLVLCEVSLDIAGLVRALAAERIAVPVVACGTEADSAAAVRAIRDGAREFLPLPPDPDLIAAILQAASGESHSPGGARPGDAGHAETRRAGGRSGGVRVDHRRESGTGKEVLARHIHRRSRRAAGPFVALNCAAIPENLLESEMFGHEKGAFSGAAARRVGKFEAADGGTLLLDEVSEMDVRLQAKLLRALQEREIDRLGGSGPVRVNVRILATSNRDLEQRRSAAGRFREDLYFRLNVVSIRIPPLRERPGDVAALAEHYARHYAEVNGLPLRPVVGRRHGPAGRAWLARQRARAGKHHAPRGAAVHRRRDRPPSSWPARRASRASATPRAGGVATPGRAHHGRRGARTSSCRPCPTRWATAPTPRPSWASPSARCATSCGTTRPAASSVTPHRRHGGVPRPGLNMPAASDTADAATLRPRHRRRRRVGAGRGRMLLAVLVMPLPTMLLDMGLALSITASVLVLMVALFLATPAGFHQLPHPAAADHAAAPVAERRDHAADPEPRQRGSPGRRARRGGVRRLPDGRRRGDRPDPVRHPAGGELHGHHQGFGPHRRGGGAVQPRCDARQADGDRRRPVGRHDQRGHRPAAPQGPGGRKRLLRRDGRRGEVRPRRRDRGDDHHHHQRVRRLRHRHPAPRHAVLGGGGDLHHLVDRRRAGVANPGAAGQHGGGHRGDQGRHGRRGGRGAAAAVGRQRQAAGDGGGRGGGAGADARRADAAVPRLGGPGRRRRLAAPQEPGAGRVRPQRPPCPARLASRRSPTRCAST